jgi:crotonobetainyl-CoA:carnitine CoA-transferase CaiB-like acyl-CoA transferase
VTRPLEGVRVVDLTHAYAGPLCTYNLGLLGADVVKVEPPDGGDDFRVWFESAFLAINAGKRSIALDLRTSNGQDVLSRLLERADVLVENYRPGVAAKLGLAADDLRSRYPRLVYCSITGFGDSGPLRDAPAIEWAVQATSGMTLEYLSGDDEPTRSGLGVVDAFSGFSAVSAILAALLQRERTGEGARLDVAMLDAAFGLLTAPVADAANGWPRRGSRLPGSGRFRARDRLLYVSCVHDEWFRGVCRVLDAPELEDDPRFATHPLRAENGDAFHAELERRFAARDAADWERELNAQGIPAAVVRTLEEAVQSEQAAHRRLLHEVESDRGPISVLGTGGAPSPARVPMLGEHTDTVLAELGYGKDVQQIRVD